MKRIEVFISGAGIAGLTLACYLARSGIYTAIIDPKISEKAQKLPHGTRTAAIMCSLLPIFDETDILEEIKEYSAPLETLKIIDTPSKNFRKPLEKIFDASEINQDAFSWNIPNNLLLNSLLKKAKTLKNLTIIPQDKIATFQVNNANVEIETETGKTYTASLLVGADGRESFIRKHSGITTKTTDLKQTAITTILSHTKPHDFTSTEIHKNGGPFTLVPLPNQRSSLVWIEHTKDAEEVLKLDQNEITTKIQTLSNDILGQIKLEDQIQHFP
ncbi:MAG: FAD-dependent monooxygenase, partial [Bdellovibrionales bacterium]